MKQNYEEDVNILELAKKIYPDSEQDQSMFIYRLYRTTTPFKKTFDEIINNKGLDKEK